MFFPMLCLFGLAFTFALLLLKLFNRWDEQAEKEMREDDYLESIQSKFH